MQTSTGMSSWRKQEPVLLPTPPSNMYVLPLSPVGVGHVPSSGFQRFPGAVVENFGEKLSLHKCGSLSGNSPQLVLGDLGVFAVTDLSSVSVPLPYPLLLRQIFHF